MVGIDSSILLSYYQSRSGGLGTNPAGLGATTARKPSPTPPWDPNSGVQRASALLSAALAGKKLISEGAAQLDVPGAGEDYRKLFALYQGLNSLYALAERAGGATVTTTERNRLQTTFDRGLAEVSQYVNTLTLDQLRLTNGEAATSAKTGVGVAKPLAPTYSTGVIFTGTAADLPPALQGDVKFDIAVKRLSTVHSVSIDLADMGSTPRTMGSVVNFINNKLAAEGVATRLAAVRTTAPPREVKVGNETVKLPAVGDAWSLTVKGDSTETVSFSAPTTTPAVYVTTKGGDPDPDKKKDTNDAVFTHSLVKIDGAQAGLVGARAFSNGMDGAITAVRASQTGPDGSVYVLADVSKGVSGQEIKGESDVAVLKYDSAGKLIWTQTLGASENANGLALAVSSDGKVAIAGSVTGGFGGAATGPLNSEAGSGLTDSFVTLLNGNGDEVWTQRRAAKKGDEAQAVAFGEGGLVYVAGRTQSSMLNGGPMTAGNGLDKYDNYLTAVAADAKGAPKTLFTTQFGTAGEDSVSGLVVSNGRIVVTGSEDNQAMLRAFDVAQTGQTVTRTVSGGVLTLQTDTYENGALTGSATQTYGTPEEDSVRVTSFTSGASFTNVGTRSLGDLTGGQIAGLAVDGGKLVIAGSTRNGALSVQGQTAMTYGAGMDGFAATLSLDLSSTAQDSLSYFGGAGDQDVTDVAVHDGKVWAVGKASSGFPASQAQGTQDAYLAQIDLSSGALVSAERISGKDGYGQGVSVTVGATGASALDKLGLPAGTLTFNNSQLLTTSTSVRAGDTLQVRNKEGGRYKTLTIAADETLASLAKKISSAAGFAAKVEVVNDGAVRRLKISPANDGATLELASGKAGADALESLGLPAGVVRRTEINNLGKTVSANGEGQVFGLKLAAGYDLSDKSGAKTAMDAIMAALGVVQKGYKELVSLANPVSALSAGPSASGPAPAYLTNQIANYQAALSRLTGG